MKCRHVPCSLQTHHELFPTHPNRLHTHTHSPKRLAHPRSPMPSLSALTARATHARPLLPAELASVPYGLVLVRVRTKTTKNGTLNSQFPIYPPPELVSNILSPIGLSFWLTYALEVLIVQLHYTILEEARIRQFSQSADGGLTAQSTAHEAAPLCRRILLTFGG